MHASSFLRWNDSNLTIRLLMLPGLDWPSVTPPEPLHNNAARLGIWREKKARGSMCQRVSVSPAEDRRSSPHALARAEWNYG